MNNVFYPGGQPYTPPHELTEEEIEKLEKRICDQEKHFDKMAYEIEVELRKDSLNDVNTLKIVHNAAEMAMCQRRHAYLKEKYAAMLRDEEEA